MRWSKWFGVGLVIAISIVVLAGIAIIGPGGWPSARLYAGTGTVEPAPLVIAIDQNYAPLTMLNAAGEPAGMLVDMWRLWAKKNGHPIEFKPGKWPETLDSLNNGQADIHSGLFFSNQRNTWLDFSAPFYQIDSRLFYARASGDNGGVILRPGQKVGVVAGSYQEQYLHQYYPQVEVALFDDHRAMIFAARQKNIAAFIGETLTVTDHLNQYGLSGEIVGADEVLAVNPVHAAVLKGNDPLLKLVNDGLAQLSQPELAEIESRWVADPVQRYFASTDRRIPLTEAEQAWLDKGYTVRVHLGNQPPFYFFDEIPQGISVDYLNHIAGQFGLKVEYVSGFPWSEALEGVKHRVVNDLLLAVTHTPEQEKYLAFSGDYLFFPWVIFTRTNSDFLSQLSDLNGQIVSVERNYAAQHFLQAHYPQINLMVVETTEQALEALATGQVAAYVGNLGAGSYIIQQRGFSNLKVAAPAPEGNHNLAMGVRADWPELASIITKGLNAMTPEEHAKIRQRWLPVRYDYQLDRSELWQWLLIIGVLSGLVFGGVLLWNRSLQVEVKQRTATELALYRRVQELSMLNRITQSLATVTNLDMVLNQVSRRVAEMFEAEFCTINLLNQTGLGIEVVAYYHRDTHNKTYSGAVFPVENNPADQYILQTGRYLLLSAEKFNTLSPGSVQKLQEQHIQTLLILPILTRNQVIGTISIGLSRPDRSFSAAEIELLETTAGQIAAALENSRLFEQEQRQRRMAESLRQVALVLSQSLNFSDVIDRILGQLHQVIRFDSAGLFLKEGNALRLTSGYGLDMDIMGFEIPLDSDIISTAVFKERKPQIIGDVSQEPRWLILSAARHIKSWMGAPLLIGDAAIGVLTLDSHSYNTYQPDDTQMLQAFANQAAIAIENARQVQRTEQSLRVTQFLYFISNLLAKATNLNSAIEEALGFFLQALHLEQGGISIFEPDMQSAHMYALYQNGRLQPVDSQENMLSGVYDYLIQTRKPLAVFDALHHPLMQDSRELTLARHIQSILFVPLIARGNLIGLLGADSTQSPRHFTDEEVELAQTVADLLATAIENAQLFEKEQQQRQVAQSLREVVAILSTSLDQNTVLSKILELLSRLISHNGAAVFLSDGDDLVLTAGILVGAPHVGMRLSLDSQNPGVRCFKEKKPMLIPDIRNDIGWQVWDGGDPIRCWMGAPLLIGDRAIGVLTADSFKVRGYSQEDARILQIFAGQAAVAIENARLFDAEQHQRRLAESALAELKITQNQLIHQEKMASLGQLTAGIAHEIKNPLNFVNNFAAMSVELADDLRGLIDKAPFEPADRAEATDLVDDLVFNAEQINEAGRRADRIIRSMLLHSRGKLGQRQEIDLNHLIDEAVHLTYHSMRAKDRDFNIVIQTDFDPTLQPMPVVPQDLSRVIVNLASNACDATQVKRLMNGVDYTPLLRIATRNQRDQVRINVWDNGLGMSRETQSKIFQPFFTTKPTGQGTGLGLSISYEIITQGHRGAIEVVSKEGEFTEFIITLPKYPKKLYGSLNG